MHTTMNLLYLSSIPAKYIERRCGIRMIAKITAICPSVKSLDNPSRGINKNPM